MIDFSTLQGVTIPEGVVTQIESGGVVLWALDEGFDGTFKVAKITSNTYAGSTTYTGEQFILLDIYPKTNGTVFVTYEGVTKTVTDTSGAEEPNAQQVYFGTFNGVSDTVITPDSGIVTITGDCRGAGCSFFNSAKYSTSHASCITEIGKINGFEIIPDGAFRSCPIRKVRIPKSVTSIGGSAFYYCDSLASVTIPASVTSIGSFAFVGCDNLTSVTIPASVTSIGDSAFASCDNLTSVTIPASVTGINGSIFAGCHNLVNIVVNSDSQHYWTDGRILFNKDKDTIVAYPSVFGDFAIPEGVTSIGKSAFIGCDNLTSVTIPASVTSIGDSAFASCDNLASVTIPASVTGIGNSAFSGCVNLASVTIPASVTSIGDYTFASCDNLTSVTIPASVTGIGKSAFSGCVNLASVTIPASVTSIGDNAFFLSSGNSRAVTLLSAIPATLGGTYTFDVAGTNNIVVPAGSGDTYKAAENWSEYADYITEG